MDQDVIATHLQDLDRRLANVEQILPTFATKEDLKTFATKEDLKTFATKEELKTFATKEDLRREVQEEGKRSRTYMKILIEQQDAKLDLLAEHVLSLMPKQPER